MAKDGYGHVALSSEVHDFAKLQALKARMTLKDWVEQAIHEKASRGKDVCHKSN